MKIVIFILISCCLSLSLTLNSYNLRKETHVTSDSPVITPEAYLNFTQIMQMHNYPYEEHFITTDDGYILRYFRIQAKNSQIVSGKPVVYLQHGLLDSSDTWIGNQEDKAPGFMLANQGYDIWLGNIRGNRYSINHTYLNTSQEPFWQYSFQNMSRFDLPAALKYITNYTGFSQVDYIGHSQGTMMMFVALSDNNQNVLPYIKHYIALAPVASIQHMDSPGLTAMARLGLLQYYEATDHYIVFPWTNNTKKIEYCDEDPVDCTDLIMFLISDAQPGMDDSDRIPVLVGHLPSGTSLWDMKHFYQDLQKGFKMFNYGTEGNMYHYGQPTNPDFNLTQITSKIFMFSGTADELADPKDVAWLVQQLEHAQVWHQVVDGFGHMTFMWGMNMSYFQNVYDILDGKYD